MPEQHIWEACGMSFSWKEDVMGKFYTITDATHKTLHLYSERGLLGYYLCNVVGPLSLLKAARNLDGVTLMNSLGAGDLQHFAAYTEFDLGNNGFGCPDGGLLLVSDLWRAFVFIEVKVCSFARSFRCPPTPNALVRDFNSSINGQMELKWRFVNALRTSLDNESGPIVTEQTVTIAPEIRDSDRFYWTRPQKSSNPADWRRTGMGGDLQSIFNDLRSVGRFCILSITADDQIPIKLLREIRLFKEDGTPLPNIADVIFWLPLSFIELNLSHRG